MKNEAVVYLACPECGGKGFCYGVNERGRYKMECVLCHNKFETDHTPFEDRYKILD